MSGSRFATSYYYPVTEQDQESGPAKNAYVEDELSVMELPAAYRDSYKAAQINRLQEWSQRCASRAHIPSINNGAVVQNGVRQTPQLQPQLQRQMPAQTPVQMAPRAAFAPSLTTVPLVTSYPSAAAITVAAQAAPPTYSEPDPIASSYYPDQTLPLAYTVQYHMVSSKPVPNVLKAEVRQETVPTIPVTRPIAAAQPQVQYQQQMPAPQKVAQPMQSMLNIAHASQSYMPGLDEKFNKMTVAEKPSVLNQKTVVAEVKTSVPELHNAYAPDESGYAWEKNSDEMTAQSPTTVNTAVVNESAVNNNYKTFFYAAPTVVATKKQDESAYYDVPNVHYAVSQSELPMSYRMVNSYSPAPVAAPVCHNAKTNTKEAPSSYEFTRNDVVSAPQPAAPKADAAVASSRLVKPIVAASPVIENVSPLPNYDSRREFSVPSNIGYAFAPVSMIPVSEYKNEALNDLVSHIH